MPPIEDDDLNRDDPNAGDPTPTGKGDPAPQDDAPVGPSNAEIAARLDDMAIVWGEIKGRLNESDKRQAEAQAAAIQQRILQAAETANTAEANAALADLNRLHEAMRNAAAQPSYTEDPNFVAFKKRNPWYGVDESLTEEADLRGEWLVKNRGLKGAALYSAVEKRMKEMFPHKFENPNRNRPSPVAETRGAERGQRGKSFNDLPPEAKKAFSDFARKGVYDATEEGRKEYAAGYWKQFEDQAHAA